MDNPPSRIVIVCPTVLDNDAVGNATLALVAELMSEDRHLVTLITRPSDRKHPAIVTVESLGDLLLEPSFLAADLIIYIFAIYNELFNAMLIGNGHAVQVVRFHNVTPKALVNESDHSVIDRSSAQIANFSSADEIWADSQENAEELARRGIKEQNIRIMPLAVKPLSQMTSKSKDNPDPIRLLYVGRFVRSKGIEDLIESLGILKHEYGLSFTARLLGNTRHSTRTYLEHLSALIRSFDLEDRIDLGGTVTEAVLSDAYRAAHIVTTASRHEGFCVPIIEGMAAGCVPVTYANSNLKHIAGGLGRLARSDTPRDLAEALMAVADAIQKSASEAAPAGLPLDRGLMPPGEFDAAAAEHVAKFAPATVAERTRKRIAALLTPSPLQAAARAAS